MRTRNIVALIGVAVVAAFVITGCNDGGVVETPPSKGTGMGSNPGAATQNNNNAEEGN